MKEKAFLTATRSHILKKYGEYQVAAKAWGVSKAYLSLILRGDRPPSKKMLNELGYDRESITVVTYKKRK